MLKICTALAIPVIFFCSASSFIILIAKNGNRKEILGKKDSNMIIQLIRFYARYKLL